MSSKSKILIVRFSSIGDIVLCSPVIRAIDKQWKGGAEIHFITKKSFAPILENNPHIAKLWTIEKSISELGPDFYSQNFDLIVDLHRNLRTLGLIFKLRRPFTRLNKLNFRKWIYVRFGINLMPDIHIVDRYLDPLKKWGVLDDGKGLDYFFPENFQSKEADNLKDKKYVVFALGGAHEGKRMTDHQWINVGLAIHHPIVLLGGKEDVSSANIIAKALEKKSVNFCNQLSLHGSATVIKNAELVLSGDTGMMHIASAFQKKIISLWGCTVPQFGMYPYRAHEASVMLEPDAHPKRPCSKLGDKCKYGMESRCITGINNDKIIREVERLLKV